MPATGFGDLVNPNGIGIRYEPAEVRSRQGGHDDVVAGRPVGQPGRQVGRILAAQQLGQGRLGPRLRPGFGKVVAAGGRAHEERLLRAGKGHIEQANIFGQTLPILIVHIALLGGAELMGEGQAHDRVLQSLGLVHRHDLHEAGIRLQPKLGSALAFRSVA